MRNLGVRNIMPAIRKFMPAIRFMLINLHIMVCTQLYGHILHRYCHPADI